MIDGIEHVLPVSRDGTTFTIESITKALSELWDLPLSTVAFTAIESGLPPEDIDSLDDQARQGIGVEFTYMNDELRVVGVLNGLLALADMTLVIVVDEETGCNTGFEILTRSRFGEAVE